MPNPYFSFKQFTVWHDKCAMKVGTDGVLLGAWANVSNADSILDVGTGTGLIALMTAQRCLCPIQAIDIDENAITQAQENINLSPWKDRIDIINADYREFDPQKKYDLILTNPPYFINSLRSPNEARKIARHTDGLSFIDLFSKTKGLLNPDGIFSLIIPTDIEDVIKDVAAECDLFPVKQTFIYTKPDVPSKRTLISFSFIRTKCLVDELVIELSRHVYSREYIELTKDYYLYM